MNEKVCHAYDTPSIFITHNNFPKFGRKNVDFTRKFGRKNVDFSRKFGRKNVENVWKFGRKSVTLQPKYSFKDI